MAGDCSRPGQTVIELQLMLLSDLSHHSSDEFNVDSLGEMGHDGTILTKACEALFLICCHDFRRLDFFHSL